MRSVSIEEAVSNSVRAGQAPLQLDIVAERRNTRTSRVPPTESESTRVHIDTDTRLLRVIFFC